MLAYDPITGYLCSYDADTFRFKCVSTPPEGAIVSSATVEDAIWGAHWLAGVTGPAFHIRGNGHVASHFVHSGEAIYATKDTAVPLHMPVIASGPIVGLPQMLRQICHHYPSHSVHACPLVNELSAFGSLVRATGERPRRAHVHSFCTDPVDASFQAFDEELDGDAFGRMADLVAQGIPVLNQIALPVGVCPFYGNIVLGTAHPQLPIYFVHSSIANDCFPDEPASATLFASATAPVQMRVSDNFREMTGDMNTFVSVMVASDYVNGLMSFMNFYGVIRKRDWFAVCPHYLLKGNSPPPVFRYNRGYRLDARMFNEVAKCYPTYMTRNQYRTETGST